MCRTTKTHLTLDFELGRVLSKKVLYFLFRNIFVNILNLLRVIDISEIIKLSQKSFSENS